MMQKFWGSSHVPKIPRRFLSGHKYGYQSCFSIETFVMVYFFSDSEQDIFDTSSYLIQVGLFNAFKRRGMYPNVSKCKTSWLSFVVSVSFSLSHWYPGSGVVLDCIDS